MSANIPNIWFFTGIAKNDSISGRLKPPLATGAGRLANRVCLNPHITPSVLLFYHFYVYTIAYIINVVLIYSTLLIGYVSALLHCFSCLCCHSVWGWGYMLIFWFNLNVDWWAVQPLTATGGWLLYQPQSIFGPCSGFETARLVCDGCGIGSRFRPLKWPIINKWPSMTIMTCLWFIIFWDDSGQLKYLDNIKFNDRTSRRHEVNDANPRQPRPRLAKYAANDIRVWWNSLQVLHDLAGYV